MKCFNKLVAIYGHDAGTVTFATLGSPNTTPCAIAAGGTTSLTINCKSEHLTFSGNTLIATGAKLVLARNSTSSIEGSKNRSPAEIHICTYKLQYVYM